jgi:hypothetical protein
MLCHAAGSIEGVTRLAPLKILSLVVPNKFAWRDKKRCYQRQRRY